MILTTKHLARWRGRLGLGASERSAREALADLESEGLKVVEVPTGRRPTRGVHVDELAEHIGADPRAILATLDLAA